MKEPEQHTYTPYKFNNRFGCWFRAAEQVITNICVKMSD
jgi:hypothetical protein